MDSMISRLVDGFSLFLVCCFKYKSMWIICGLAINIVFKLKHRLIDRSVDRSIDRSTNRSNFIGRLIYNNRWKKGQSYFDAVSIPTFSSRKPIASWSFDERLNVKHTLWPSIWIALRTITISGIFQPKQQKIYRAFHHIQSIWIFYHENGI